MMTLSAGIFSEVLAFLPVEADSSEDLADGSIFGASSLTSGS